ncbi:hypothetical protein TRFO_04470 [Tritrichomonas foetus]|uniref:Uncharacterized protein n=1 Tax=Tritrichomonas foetus TaxID=1144522 RepID=A0A1J4KFW1_9EUKA|nr:hypothetical protein TRFO_04470 [Tritrichomonas foetus]|eukprot:OHT09914.1 hypothetical protein TRFO_04470 [Tritrichomonas foetus]
MKTQKQNTQQMMKKKVAQLTKVVGYIKAAQEEYHFRKDYLFTKYDSILKNIQENYFSKMNAILFEYNATKEREEKLVEEYKIKFDRSFKKSIHNFDILKINNDNSLIIERKIDLLQRSLKKIIVTINTCNLSDLEEIIENMKTTIETENENYQNQLAEIDSTNLKLIFDLIKKLTEKCKKRLEILRNEVEDSQKTVGDMITEFGKEINRIKKAFHENDKIMQSDSINFEKTKKEIALYKIRMNDDHRNNIREQNDFKAQKAMDLRKIAENERLMFQYYQGKNQLLKQNLEFNKNLLDFNSKNRNEVQKIKELYSDQIKDVTVQINELLQNKDLLDLIGPEVKTYKYFLNLDLKKEKEKLDKEYRRKKIEARKLVIKMKKELEQEEKRYEKELQYEKATISCIMSQVGNHKLNPNNEDFPIKAQLSFLINKLRIMKNKIYHDKSVFINKMECTIQDEKDALDDMVEAVENSTPIVIRMMKKQIEQAKESNDKLNTLQNQMKQYSHQLIRAKNKTYHVLNTIRKEIDDEKKKIEQEKELIKSDFNTSNNVNESIINDYTKQLQRKKSDLQHLISNLNSQHMSAYSQMQINHLNQREKYIEYYQSLQHEYETIKPQMDENEAIEISKTEGMINDYQHITELALNQRYKKNSNNLEILDNRIAALEKQNFILMQLVEDNSTKVSQTKISALKKRLRFLDDELYRLQTQLIKISDQTVAAGGSKLTKSHASQSVNIVAPKLNSLSVLGWK